MDPQESSVEQNLPKELEIVDQEIVPVIEIETKQDDSETKDSNNLDEIITNEQIIEGSEEEYDYDQNFNKEAVLRPQDYSDLDYAKLLQKKSQKKIQNQKGGKIKGARRKIIKNDNKSRNKSKTNQKYNKHEKYDNYDKSNQKYDKKLINKKNRKIISRSKNSKLPKNRVITRGSKDKPFSRINEGPNALVIKTSSKTGYKIKPVREPTPSNKNKQKKSKTKENDENLGSARKRRKIRYCNSYNKGEYLLYRHFMKIGEWVKILNSHKADFTPFTLEKNIIWEAATISLVTL